MYIYDRTKYRGIIAWMNNFPKIFSSLVCFLFAITNGMVKVLMEGCFRSNLFDFTNIHNSFSCFLATFGKKLENDPMFPIKNFPSEHNLNSAYIVSVVLLVEILQLVQKCSLSAGHLSFLEGDKTSESLGYVVISRLPL